MTNLTGAKVAAQIVAWTLLILTGFYLAGSLIAWNYNFVEWSNGLGRFVMVALSVCCAGNITAANNKEYFKQFTDD